MDNEERFEIDREDRAVNENPYDEVLEYIAEDEITFDEVAEEPDQMQRALGAYRLIEQDNARKQIDDELDNILRAAEATQKGNKFLMSAFKRFGVC